MITVDDKVFKPNLIPNNPKDGSWTREKRNEVIDSNGGIENYVIANKKDGCRMQMGLDNTPLTRSLKKPKSELVLQRFHKLNQICKQLNIAIDGEFYVHGLKFNEIFRFFSNVDVTREEYKEKLLKKKKQKPAWFAKEYGGRSVEFLTTFHQDLKFWIFDGIVLDMPELGFNERMLIIESRLAEVNQDDLYLMSFVSTSIADFNELDYLYEQSLQDGWEGLVITHKDHKYKFGRNTINEGTILKMKDDMVEYDGIILDIVEGTKIKEGIEKGQNKLGRSTTSQKKDDREPSGMAKGFLIQYKDLGTFIVGLKSFDNEAKKELLKNKFEYLDKHFKYHAMAPVKDFPRHAYFKAWRDSK